MASPALMPFTSSAGAETFRAALRAPLLQAEDFRRRLGGGTLTLEGWSHADDAIIEAQGALTRHWTAQALPKLKFLPGLVPRLGSPGQRFSTWEPVQQASPSLCADISRI